MLGFAIHTSSPQLGLCLHSVDEGVDGRRQIARHQVWDFTGSRLGVVAARTLAQQLDIPLFGVSTLAALATGAQAEHIDVTKDIAVMIPAKREAVFGAIYRSSETGDLQPVVGDNVMPADEWTSLVEGWEQPLVVVQADMGVGMATSVTGVMDLAIARWHLGQRPGWASVMPFYGQHPVHR